MVYIYGITHCDIVKKALKYLQAREVAYTFLDYKKEGISTEKLQDWCGKAGWQTVFNKRSTTWKEIAAAEGSEPDNEASAIRLMQQHSSIIKRPVVEINGKLIVGYDEAAYQQHILSR